MASLHSSWWPTLFQEGQKEDINYIIVYREQKTLLQCTPWPHTDLQMDVWNFSRTMGTVLTEGPTTPYMYSTHLFPPEEPLSVTVGDVDVRNWMNNCELYTLEYCV